MREAFKKLTQRRKEESDAVENPTGRVLFPLGRAHRLTLRDVSRVIAVSGAGKSALLARRIFPADKIRVVPNGVDASRFEGAHRTEPTRGRSGSA